MKINRILYLLSLFFLYAAAAAAAAGASGVLKSDSTNAAGTIRINETAARQTLNLDEVFARPAQDEYRAVTPAQPSYPPHENSAAPAVNADSLLHMGSTQALSDSLLLQSVLDDSRESDTAMMQAPRPYEPLKFVPRAFEPILLDSMYYIANPLFNELVFMGKEIDVHWEKPSEGIMYYGLKPRTLYQPVDTIKFAGPEETLASIRRGAYDYIVHTGVELFKRTRDELPKVSWDQFQTAITKPVEHLQFDEDGHVPVVTTNRIVVRNKKVSLWRGKANALLQFSQTAVSNNWHKGGNDFFSLLGVLTASMNYDYKKKVIWKNDFEWRTGFNTVEGDSLRKAMPSDDMLRVNSYFGLQASGNFYYSTSLLFKTQFFQNPKKINSKELKASFLTPMITELGVGMTYNKKVISIGLEPLTLRHVYLTDTLPQGKYSMSVDPGHWKIEKGENSKLELGNKITAKLNNYRPFSELKLNSTFEFFYNYKQDVIINWEIIAELAINRYLSTRLMLNPRYDTTATKEGEKTKMQIKEMLTVGFSYRLF